MSLEPSSCELGLFYKDGKQVVVKVVDEATRKERPITLEDVAVLAAQADSLRRFEEVRRAVRNPKYVK